jgi:hypothetical protein
MENYQIRIARDGSETLTHACLMASDYAAIRHARNLAGYDGAGAEHIEVWRRGECVFAGNPGAPGLA